MCLLKTVAMKTLYIPVAVVSSLLWLSFAQRQYLKQWRSSWAEVIASWKLNPIPRQYDVQYHRIRQFLEAVPAIISNVKIDAQLKYTNPN